jgi:cyclophilin family peptidyl-prolyl cis-trans isomerase
MSYVTMDTSVGSFTVELYTKHAPKVSGSVASRHDASSC